MDLAVRGYSWCGVVWYTTLRVNEFGKPHKDLMKISRVPDQIGVSLLYIMLEIHHSGREPSNFDENHFN